jgi:hypothetical protein
MKGLVDASKRACVFYESLIFNSWLKLPIERRGQRVFYDCRIIPLIEEMFLFIHRSDNPAVKVSAEICRIIPLAEEMQLFNPAERCRVIPLVPVG